VNDHVMPFVIDCSLLAMCNYVAFERIALQ